MGFADTLAGYDILTLANPASALTDFTYFVDLSRMSATWWANVASDGKDIRACRGDGTEVARDLEPASWDYAGKKGLLCVKYAGTKASSGTEYLWLGCGNGALSAPADNATYGQFNAYASHWKAFYPSGGGVDRTTNVNTLTMTGSPTVGGVAGPINNKATDFNGSSQYGKAAASVPTGIPITLILYGNPDNITANCDAMCVSDTATDTQYFRLTFRGADAGDFMRAGTTDSNGEALSITSTAYSATTWQQGVALFTSAISRQVGKEGVLATPPNATSRTPAGIDTIGVGALTRTGAAAFFDGKLSLVEVHNSALSADWITYDYTQVNSQSTMFGTPTWQALGAVQQRSVNINRTVQQASLY